MYVYVVQTCIRCGTNMELGGTKMGGMKRRWYEKTSNQRFTFPYHAFETPLSLGSSVNLPWVGYGYFLELHIFQCC